jgi:ribosome production factor 1
MAQSKPANTASGFKPKNKLRRQAAYLNIKKAREGEKRDFRLRRRREEEKDPSLREQRHAQNVPATIDSKRVWDEPVGDEEDALGFAVDVERLAKRRKVDQEAAEEENENGEQEGTLAKLKKLEQESGDEDMDHEADSMLDSDSELDDASDSDDSDDSDATSKKQPAKRAPSPSATSTGTNLELSPEFLKQKFPQLFSPHPEPKVLITTSINSTLHKEAEVLTSLFPNSTYIRRTAGAHGYRYSVREIAKFASNKGYTALVVLMQAHIEKKPDGLDVINLPEGPHFHFSVCVPPLSTPIISSIPF